MSIQVPVLLSCASPGAGWPGGEAPQLSAPAGGCGHETWRWSELGDQTGLTRTDQYDPYTKLHTHIIIWNVEYHNWVLDTTNEACDIVSTCKYTDPSILMGEGGRNSENLLNQSQT